VRRTTLWLAGMGIAAIICGAVLAFASATVGNAAPALDVPELDGQTFNLGAQHGKVVVVNFWATWCPHLLTLPLNRRHRRKATSVIGKFRNAVSQRTMKMPKFPSKSVTNMSFKGRKSVNAPHSWRLLPPLCITEMEVKKLATTSTDLLT
jgi:thiol-disulfide isomerase/thioredoxin